MNTQEPGVPTTLGFMRSHFSWPRNLLVLRERGNDTSWMFFFGGHSISHSLHQVTLEPHFSPAKIRCLPIFTPLFSHFGTPFYPKDTTSWMVFLGGHSRSHSAYAPSRKGDHLSFPGPTGRLHRFQTAPGVASNGLIEVALAVPGASRASNPGLGALNARMPALWHVFWWGSGGWAGSATAQHLNVLVERELSHELFGGA